MRTPTLRLLLALTLGGCLIGCRTPVPTLGPSAPAPAAKGWDGPWGTANLSISLPAGRRVQLVEGYRATRFEAYVSGAGLIGKGTFENDWLPLTPLSADEGKFGVPTSSGVRLGAISAKVPAGDRRVFRVRIYDATPEPDQLLQELWGVENIDANVTVISTRQVEVKPLTTPTGKIFLELIKADAAKALNLPIENVQHFVEELTNTNVQGDPLRAGQAQVSPMVLHVPRVAAAILRGNAGVPFQIPVPVPATMLARDADDPNKLTLTAEMRRRGQVRLRVVDYHGRTLSRPMTYSITDPATPARTSSATEPAEHLFTDVSPSLPNAPWQIQAVDMDRAHRVSKPLTVTEGQVQDVQLVIPPGLETVCGALDWEANASGATQFNGDDLAPSVSLIKDPNLLAIHDGRLYFWDNGNYRLRRFTLNDPSAVVGTFAGNGGSAGPTGDGGPATSAQLQMSSGHEMVFDKHGRLFISQNNSTLRMIDTDGTIKTFWAPGSYVYAPERLAYDATRHHLYVGTPYGTIYKLDLNVFTGANPAQAYDATKVAQTGIERIATDYYSNDLAVAGDHLFYTTRPASSTVIRRRHLVSGTVDTIMGTTAKGAAGEETPALDLTENNLKGLVVDRGGNLFFRANAGLYRLSGATAGTAAANDWRVKLLIADGNIRDLALDPATDDLYVATRQSADWLPYNGTRDVIRKLVP